MLIFSGRKSCTGIIESILHSFLHFSRAKDVINHLTPVVQTLDSVIHRINHFLADKYYGNQLRYPLDSDLSGG